MHDDPIATAAESVREVPLRAFRAAVSDVRSRSDTHVRAVWTIERRVPVLRTAPSQRTGALLALPDPDRVDPWGPEPPGAVDAACPACDGVGSRACATCDGSGAIECPTCSGGRHTSETPCAGCGGTGSVGCGCVDGRDSCDRCAGSGVVRAWIQVTKRAVVRTLTSGPPDLAEGTLDRSWQGRVGDLPVDLEALLEGTRPPTDDAERASTVQVEVRRGESAIVSFRLAGVDGEIEVRDRRVVRTVTEPVLVRRSAIRLGAVLGAVFAVATCSGYVSRDFGWYAAQPNTLGLLAFVAIWPFLAGRLAAEACTPGFLSFRRAPLVGGVGVAAVVHGWLAVTGGATIGEAEDALTRGDLERARLAAGSVAARSDADLARATAVLDRVATQQLASADLAESARLVSEEFHDPAARAAAADTLVTRVVQEAEGSLARREVGAATEALALLPASARSDPRAVRLALDIDLTRVDGCVAALDATCVAAARADALSRGATEAELLAKQVLADQVARAIVDPLWTAAGKSKNPARGRYEACRALIGPVQFAASAGSSAFRPTPAEVDERCAAVAAKVR